MRKGVSFLLWIFICISAGAQTTVFSDNFNASTGAAYTAAAGPIGSSTTWSLSRSGVDWGGKIDVGVMDLSNDVSASANVNGWTFGYTPTASFTAPYTTTLNANTSTVTWYFNMRQIRANPAGFTAGSYGVAFVLGGTSTTANNTGDGYAVVLGNTGAVDPVRLVKYTGGLITLGTTLPPTANDLIVSNTAGLTTFGTEYLSVKVTYVPSTNTWELFLRNDGSSAFTDPTTGTLVSQGTAADATYTGVALDYLGGYWQGSTGATQTAFFDNVNVTVGLPPANTITTGVVTGAPFSLGNCAATASGTVAFTSTDVFAGGNIFTAQLSDDIGSFVSPTNIGTLALSGTDPSGTINITIPAGTVSGTGYQIRVVSSNPTITGSSSAAFTITQAGLCASSHTDYYRSFQTGDWVDNTTWESSPDNVSWIAATLAPTFNANTITIRNTHTVTIISSSSADQLTIDAGGTLVHSNGQSFTLNNGTGTDMTVNGTYVLNGTQPSGTGTIEIPSGGLVRVEGNAAPGESDDFAFGNANVTFRTGCTYEWATTLFTPSWTARTFFTIGENTLYLFSQTPSFALGGANPTVIYGTLEATAPITFTGAGTKTIANGILGSAAIDASGSTGNIFITGSATSVLGGAGLLTLPPSPSYLMVGGSTVLSMTSSKQVTGIINFANFGYIQLGAFDLTVNGSLTGGNTIAHVISDGIGFLKITAIGAGPVVFPIGADVATYNPVTVRSGGGADYSARVEVGLNPAIFNNNFAILRTWNLKSSATVAGVDIDLEYNGSQGGPSFNYAGFVEVGAFIGVSWNIIATGLTPTGTYLVNVNPVNVLTAGVSVPIVIGNLGSILPVDCIVGCRSQKVNNKGVISWDVNTCAEVTSFEIQRSVNRGAFTTIGTVSPYLGLTTFNYTDDALASGTNLYRIKVNRVTGGSKFSNTVAIINGGGDLFISQVSPNPAHDQAWITVSAGKKSTASFTVFNQSGQPVKQWQSALTDGSNRISLDMLNLPAGNYTLSAVSGENRTVYRFVKQ